MSEYPEAAARFARETAGHQMTVLHDDGLYRHIRFANPKSGWGFYWFELITVPGSLIFRGDGESFVFSRSTDMFDFFRRSSWKGGINPQYWSEKLTSDRDSVMKYDEKLFERQVKQHVVEAIRNGDAPRGIGAEVTREIFEWGDITHEAGARAELESFEHEGFKFHDVWEWNFQDYHWWFLWACNAIVWGIGRYDKVASYGLTSLATPAPVEAVTS